MTQAQAALLDRIKPSISPEIRGRDILLAFFQHIDVEIWASSSIERDMVPNWMPDSNRSRMELFRLLRDRVGGAARNRGAFTSESLRRSLADEGVHLAASPDIEGLRQSVRGCGSLLRLHKHSIGRTGEHVRIGAVAEILDWAARDPGKGRVAMLLDGAGMGKTVVARDVLIALEDAGVTALAIKADQQLSGIADHEQLQASLRMPEPVERVVGILAAEGPVVVIVDQVDALSLSLARDQRALDVVLDLVGRLRLIPGVVVLLSCRSFDRNGDPRLRRIEVEREFRLAGLTDDVVAGILRRLRVDAGALSPATRELLRVPLHLDLFAMALEAREASLPVPRPYGDISSLQDLYGLVWQDAILRPDPASPPASERVEVLNRVTERMAREQRTTVPRGMFATAEAAHLERAVAWLASIGILIPGGAEWGFLHQTFFDYCYARRFVERGDRLLPVLRGSRQGLFERPLLVQVLAFLRAIDPRLYLPELQDLFDAPEIRPHLRDLLFRWFGALPTPGDGEWSVAYRLLFDPTERPRLLAAMAGNPDWFARIKRGPIRALLAQDDRILDSEVIPYLNSMADSDQAGVIEVAAGMATRGDRWTIRAAWIVSCIREWKTSEAITLFERLAASLDDFLANQQYQLDGVARADPAVGCRLVRLSLDRVLRGHLASRGGPGTLLHSFLTNALEQLNGGGVHKIMMDLARSAPAAFLECTAPWLEEAVRTTALGDDTPSDFGIDDLCQGWHDLIYVVRQDLIRALATSLAAVARSDLADFRRWATRMAALPYRTPQQLLAQVYHAEPGILADDAHRFLLGDRRRLWLGDHEQYESRQFIAAIHPFLSGDKRAELEEFIIAHPRLRKRAGVDGLRRRGVDQLRLLGAIPDEHLTGRGRSYLDEMRRKFPDGRPSDGPIRMICGMVKSPIDRERAGKMSDRAWVRAMAKYRPGVRHRQPLRRGAEELGGVLYHLITGDPGRFYRLVMRTPSTITRPYAGAFIGGLAGSPAPAEWVFAVARMFGGDETRQSIARALRQRIDCSLPADLVALLEALVRDRDIPDVEVRADPHDAYLNSDRGAALGTLLRAVERQGDEAVDRRWGLIEFVASDPSTPLRAGAVEELLRLLAVDESRAIELFERLMDGHPALMGSRFTSEFLYYGLHGNFSRLVPFIRDLMDEPRDEHRQRGAELACVAAISPSALRSGEERDEARQLTDAILSGPAPWRRGAARVFATNLVLDESLGCMSGLLRLVDDEDDQVRRIVSGSLYRMREDHLSTYKNFLNAYAHSRTIREGLKPFGEYLWAHGMLDPTWTLTMVDVVLANPNLEGDGWGRHSGGEELIRLVLRAYNDPTARESARSRAMHLFDRLMGRYSGQARAILDEWDRRKGRTVRAIADNADTCRNDHVCRSSPEARRDRPARQENPRGRATVNPARGRSGRPGCEPHLVRRSGPGADGSTGASCQGGAIFGSRLGERLRLAVGRHGGAVDRSLSASPSAQVRVPAFPLPGRGDP